MPQQRDDENLADSSATDDAIIGRALRYSIGVILLLAGVVAIVYWWWHRSPTEVVSASRTARAPTPAPLAPRSMPVIRFTDVSQAAGLSFVHINGAYGERLLPETMGGGVAFFDYDGDRDQDLLLVGSNYWPWDPQGRQPVQSLALLSNDGSGRFVLAEGEQPDFTGYGMGVAVADYDGDGFVDIYITAVGSNRLYRNLGGRGFEDVSAQAGVAGPDQAWSTAAAFADFDGDGDLDLAVANYVQWNAEIDRSVGYQLVGIGRAYGPPTDFPGSQLLYYVNQGDGRFVEAGKAAGLHVNNAAGGEAVAKSLALMPADLEGDGDIDLLVANDTTRNFAFINRGDGVFDEQGQILGLAFDNTGKATGAMGIDLAALSDGAPVVVAIGNFANEMTSFYVSQDQPLLFSDDAIIMGVGPRSRLALTFGLFFFDVDLDGALDFLQVNGHVENEIGRVQPSQSHAQLPQLFWHCGPTCPAVMQKAEVIGDLAQPLVARGASYADIDGDGDLDIAIVQNGREAKLFRNDSEQGHWFRLRLHGRPPNTGAIGARVVLWDSGRRQQRQVMPTRSYLSQTELTLTFGLGQAERIQRIEIVWPDGQRQQLNDVAVDQTLDLQQVLPQL